MASTAFGTGYFGPSYDSWRTSYPSHWDEPEVEEAEEFELCEKFTFGGLTYLLTGEYDGGALDKATLYLITNYGLIRQFDPVTTARESVDTDWITESGYVPGSKAESLTDRCYAVADAALEAATEAA